MAFPTELEQRILKFVWKHKRLVRAKTTPRKKNRSKQRGTGTKADNKLMEQNRQPKNKPTHLWSINLCQRRQKYTMEKRVSSISSAWKTGQLHVKRMKLEHFLTLYTKINSKWVKDLNVRPETIKPPEENIARLLCDINCSNVFLDLFPKVKEAKAKISKWNLNLKAFAQQRKP